MCAAEQVIDPQILCFRSISCLYKLPVPLHVELMVPLTPALTLITLWVPCSAIMMSSSLSPHWHFVQGISSWESYVRQLSWGCQQSCSLVLLPMQDARLPDHPQFAFCLAEPVRCSAKHSHEPTRRQTHCMGGTWSYMSLPKCSLTFLSDSGPLSDTFGRSVIFATPAFSCVLDHHLI